MFSEMRVAGLLRCALLAVGVVGQAHAERYAVLVGVGKYLHVRELDGPAFDVASVRSALLANGYAPAAITVLLDEQGTRPKIVQALSQAVGKLKTGDHLLFYYSGHGTSAFDKSFKFQSPEIGPDSGALATYDVSVASAEAAVESLVIGRRDLRPILSRVPAGAQALVILDACYSENSAKSLSVFEGAPIRGINIVDLLPNGQVVAGSERPGIAIGPATDSAYPYPNVVSLSAASKEQPALDINLATMKSKPEWRTVDGRPHGALTNTLLEAMSGQGDTNRDGAMSYDEMYRYVRREMERFPHQPQLLSDGKFRLDQPALGKAMGGGSQPATQPTATGKFRVKLEAADASLEAKLRAVAEIELVAERYDLLIRPAEGLLGLFDQSGVLIQRIPPGDKDAVAGRVRAQALVWQLRNWASADQKFNVRIDAAPEAASGYDKLRTVFGVGERVRFRISSEKPAFLLLIGLDKDGTATVLFPGPAAKDKGQQPADQPNEFVAAATGPAGSEQLKLIGFATAPEGWDAWSCSARACPSFPATDARMVQLMQMLRNASGTAESSLRLITQQ